MSRLMLDPREIEEIRTLLGEVAQRYSTPENTEFLNEADVIAHSLPLRVRQELRRFRLFEPSDAIMVVAGYPIDQEQAGPTPTHWKTAHSENDTLEYELLLVLLGSLLGEPIGWSTQQDGRIVHDILPIKGHENEQLGSGSEETLTWHVEDAFHPYRGDYLGMLCLRNPDRIPTTFAALNKVELTAEEVETLSGAHFTIRPDESHLPKNRGADAPGDEELLQRSYRKIEKMWNEPEKIAVLFGDPGAPYIRLDPYFMDPVQDQAAQSTLEALTRKIDGLLEDQVLEPGDFCFIDNFQAVHGRKPFKARYDGNDRWLKRINVTRDLRKSREARGAAEARVLF